MATRCRPSPHCGEAGSGLLRTLAPLTGTANGQSRRLDVPDGLSPLHGGSKGAQRPFDAPPASCARPRPTRDSSTFRAEISQCAPPSAISAILLTVLACSHPMAGQLPAQPPSEATWARARALDAPVDLGRRAACCCARAPSAGRRRPRRACQPAPPVPVVPYRRSCVHRASAGCSGRRPCVSARRIRVSSERASVSRIMRMCEFCAR